MIRQQFLDYIKSDANTTTVHPVFWQVWKKLIAFEKDNGISLDDGFTREQYVELFNSMKIRHYQSITVNKSYIMQYVDYLIEHDVLGPEQRELLSSISLSDIRMKDTKYKTYFKNLQDMQSAIQDTITDADRADEGRFDVPVAILYLAWYGLTEEQIINLKKEDVLEDGILLDGQKIEMESSVAVFLNNLKESDGYTQQARGEIFRKYVYSDYLIRTERTHQLNLNGLRGILYRMNNFNGKVYSLRYDVAHFSGIFYRAYMLECNSVDFPLDDPEFASEVFHEDLSDKFKLCRRVQDYQLYKKLFS